MSKTLTAERLANMEMKIGITKDGAKNGNGLISKIDDVKKELSVLSIRTNKNTEEIKDLKRIFESLENIQNSIDKINNELKGNISFKTVATAKNIIIGTAGVLTALGIVGAAIVKIYSMFRN